MSSIGENSFYALWDYIVSNDFIFSCISRGVLQRAPGVMVGKFMNPLFILVQQDQYGLKVTSWNVVLAVMR